MIAKTWKATGAWTVGLVALATLYSASGGLPGGEWSLWWILDTVVGAAGIILPLAAFAGGVAALAHRGLDRKAVVRAVLAALTVSLVTYGLNAYAQPMAEYTEAASRGIDVSTQRPFGPTTPSGLLRQRAYIRANPPDSYSFDIGRPFDRPPNWLTFELYFSAAWAVLAVLSTLLGLLTAGVTTGLSPPVRRHARWALGLVLSVLSFIAADVCASVARRSLTASGLVWAWLTLAVPLAGLILLGLIWRRRTRALHTPRPPRV